MPFCPSCHSEYEDWVDTCADCNVALTPTLAPASGCESGRAVFRPLTNTHPFSEEATNTHPFSEEATNTHPSSGEATNTHPSSGEAGRGSELQYTPPQPLPVGGEMGSTHPQPLPVGGEIITPPPSGEAGRGFVTEPRYQGRNRRLKVRLDEPTVMPPPLLESQPLDPGTALPVALNFDLNPPRHTYDPAGDKWVVLISAPNEIMAQLLRSQLADDGIPALIKLNAAADNGQFINNQWVARDIWIQARDVGRALEVVDFYHNDSPLTGAGQNDAAENGATASGDGNYEMERPPLYESPWVPTEHYEDPDMVAANASVDEQGRPLKRDEYRSPIQRPWFRWLTFLLLLAWAAPYLLELLAQIGKSIATIFR
jgi:Putative prokaryotic signal transducing protein